MKTNRITRSNLTRNIAALLATAGAFTPIVSHAASGSWALSAGGAWGTAANWSPAAVPGSAAGDVITITSNLAAASTISLDAVRTMGSLVLGDADSTAAFTLSVGTAGGAITLDQVGVVGTATALVQFGATGSSAAIGNVIQGPITLADNARFYTTLTTAQQLTGIISGAGRMVTFDNDNGTPAGPVSLQGQFLLTGANTYSGGTTINDARVQITTANTALGAAGSAVTIQDGGQVYTSTALTNINYAFSIAGQGWLETGGTFGALRVDGGAIVTGNVTMTAASGIGSAGTGAINGVVSGAFLMSKRGTGTLTLGGVNTYSGGTDVTAGALQANNNAAFGTGAVTISGAAARTLVNGGVTLANNFTVNAGVTGTAGVGLIGQTGTGQATVNGSITLNSVPTAGGTFAANNNVGNELVLAGPISGNVGASHRDGRIIYKNASSTATGSLNVTGTALVGVTNGMPVGWSALLGGSGNATIDLNGFDQTLAGLTVGNITAGSAFVGTVSLGAQVLTLNGDITSQSNTAQNVTHIISATAGGGLNTGASARTINLADTVAADDLAITGAAITGAGGIIKTGAGALALNGVTLTGPLSVNVGTLATGRGAQIGSITAPSVAFATGTTLRMKAGTGGDLIDGGIVTTAGTTVRLTQVGGALPIAAYPIINFTGAAPTIGAGGLTLAAVGHSTSSLSIIGNSVVLDVTGNDQVIWDGTNSTAWSTAATGNWKLATLLTPTDYIESDDVIFPEAPLGAAVAIAANVSPSKVTFNNTATAYTLSGTAGITGPTSVTVAGAGGIVTITNPNTYTGATNVSAGATLNLTGGSLNGSNITVAAGATFAATGVIAGPSVTLTTSGTTSISGANTFTGATTVSAGTLTMSGGTLAGSNVTVAPGATFTQSGGVISGLGTTFTTSGTTTLAGANTFNGDVLLDGGILIAAMPTAAAVNTALGASINPSTRSKTIFITNNGIFRNTSALFNDNTGSGTVLQFVFNIGSGGGTFDTPAATLMTLDDNAVAGNAQNAAQLQGTGTLTKTGDGILSLGNSASNFGTFTGAIFVNAGTLTTGATSTNAFGTTALGTTIASGATLDVKAAANIAEPLTISGTGVGGLGALISSVTGGGVAGPITLADNSSIGGAAALALSGVISGGFSITKVGAGATTLSNIGNSYGDTIINAGQLTANDPGTLPTATNLIFTGGTLDPSNDTHSVASISGTAGSINQGTVGTGVVRTTQSSTTSFQGTVNRVTVDMSGSGSLSLGGAADNAAGSVAANSGLLILAKGDTAAVSQALHAIGTTLTINSGGTVQLGGACDNITTPGIGVNLAPVGINTATYVDQIYNQAVVNLNLGGTLDLNGRQEAVSNLTHSTALGGTVTNSSATPAKIYIGHQGGSATFAGTIQDGLGGVSMEKVGAGTVAWTGAHTFTGTTVISGGQLNVLSPITTSPVIVADGGSLGGESSITNVTLGTATTGNVAFDPNTVGALTVGTLTVNGTASTVDFAALPTGAGPWIAMNYTTLAGAGTIGFANAASYRVAPIVVAAAGVVTVDITGTKALTWTGTGAVTTVWDNNVNTNWADITPAPDNFFAGDTVTFGDGPTVVGVTVTSGVTPSKTTVNSVTNSYTLNSTTNGIAGGGNLEKSGASTLTLVGPNTYSGQTIISGGTVSISAANSLGNAGPTNSIALSTGGRLSNNAAAALDLGATRSIAVGTGGGSISHNNAAAATITVSGNLTGSGTDNLSFHSATTGPGTFLLSGSNSGYTGKISIDSSGTGITTANTTVNLSTASAVPNASSITINYPAAATTTGNATTLNLNGVTLPVGTTLNMTAFLNGAISLRSQITSQGTSVINGPITVTGNAGSVIQFAPTIAGSTLTINGNITEATPGSFGSPGVLGVVFLRNNGLTVVNGTINLPNAMISRVDSNGSTTINSTGNVWAATDVRGATTLRIGATNALAVGAYLQVGQTSDAGVSLFDMNGFSQEVTGLTSLIGTASNGRAITNSSATPGTLTINNTNNYTFGNSTGFTGGNLTGNLSLVKTGTGTQTIAGPANTYIGNVTVNGGTLIAGGGSASTALGNPTLAGRTVTANNTGTILSLATNNVYGNGIGNLNLPATILNSGTTLTTASYNVLGDLTLNGATLTQSVTGNANYEGYQFRSNVTVGGGAASTIATTTAKPNHLGTNTLFNVANATGDAATDLLVSAALRNQSGDFASAVGGLTKTGNGTMELSAAVNNYTGATVVDAGKLIVNGSISGSAVTVNAAGILGGNAITGALTVAGGTVAPGNSVGTVTTPTLTLSGGVYAVEMTGASVNDQIIVSTAASITANTALTLDFSTFDPVDFVDTFTIILNNGAGAVGTTGLLTYNGTPLNNSDLFNATSGAFNQDFTINYAGGDGNDVVLTAVPEPGSALLLLGGFSSLVCLQRRRRNA